MSPRRLATTLLTALLAGCGGGLYLQLGDGGFDDPPSVSLVVDHASASPGETLRFVAAASDDFGVDEVSLYRREADGSATLVATDRSAPWEWSLVVAAGTRGELRYFARATDFVRQETDSDPVVVTVRQP